MWLDDYPNARALESGAECIKALGHRERLKILCCLLDGERCVGELEQRIALHQPNLSQHLTVLRRTGLVETRRDSKRIYYRIQNPHVVCIMHELLLLAGDCRPVFADTLHEIAEEHVKDRRR